MFRFQNQFLLTVLYVSAVVNSGDLYLLITDCFNAFLLTLCIYFK